MMERGDLVEVTGRERFRVYEAPRIFAAVYGPVEFADVESDRQLSLDPDRGTET